MWNENSGISKEEAPYNKKIIFPATAGKKSTEDKNKNLLLFQCIICLIIFCVCYILSVISPTAKSDIKKYISHIINDGTLLTTKEDIARLAQGFINTVKKTPSEENTTNTVFANENAYNDILNSYNTSGATDSILQQNNFSQESGEEAQQEEPSGQGGYAYEYTDNENTRLPYGVTLADYTLTEQPYMPVESALLTDGFGYRKNPITGKEEFHTGTDLAAAENSAVYSSFYGIVIETGFDEVRGNYVFIKHSDSLVTQYSHLHYIFVSAGDIVKKGELIGCVGSSGMSTGPHLHFEIKIDGIYVNPRNYLTLPVYDAL